MTLGQEERPALGLIAHMDTAPDASGKDVHPQILEKYDGQDVLLKASGRYLRVSDFPNLRSLKGRTLITTDGSTLLGADDKAGIAEILTVAEKLLASKEPHGKICIGFTPDEEIARGANHFDLAGFGATYAYTLDGGPEGEIQFENFNAATAYISVHGVSTHTGSAKNVLVNSQSIAMEFHQALPASERPESTEGYEGFYHLVSTQGNVTETRLRYLIRDFDSEKFEQRKEYLRNLARSMNETYGEGRIEVEIVDSYRNMKEKIAPVSELIEYATEATKKAGVKPLLVPVRGGTDGARLSFKGLPCPNLGTGGYGYHGKCEHITAEAMDLVVEIVLDIIHKIAQ